MTRPRAVPPALARSGACASHGVLGVLTRGTRSTHPGYPEYSPGVPGVLTRGAPLRREVAGAFRPPRRAVSGLWSAPRTAVSSAAQCRAHAGPVPGQCRANAGPVPGQCRASAVLMPLRPYPRRAVLRRLRSGWRDALGRPRWPSGGSDSGEYCRVPPPCGPKKLLARCRAQIGPCAALHSNRALRAASTWRCHICAGTGLTPAASAPGLPPPTVHAVWCVDSCRYDDANRAVAIGRLGLR
jgi:hypothetical protein